MPKRKTKAPFRSRFEQRIAEQLDEAKIKYEYEAVEVEYDLEVHRGNCNNCGSNLVTSTRSYLTDFYVPSLDFYIEVKGRFTSTDRTKMRSVVEQHPDLDVRMLFMRDNKLNKRSKTCYSDWCEKNGIKYAVGTIPEDWLE